MAEKIIFNDLVQKNETKPMFKIIKINDEDVEVKQYLPINDKLNLITAVLRGVAQNEYSFVNPVQMDVYSIIEIIDAYTNIEFTEEEKLNPADAYDALEKGNIGNKVVSAIPEAEYKFVMDGIEATVTAYYAYRNSVKGIIEDITTDYSNLDLNATEIQEKLNDPDNLSLLKTVVEKLG